MIRPNPIQAPRLPREDEQRLALARARRHAGDALACSAVMRLVGRAAEADETRNAEDVNSDLASAISYLGLQLSYHAAEALEACDDVAKTLPEA